MDIVDTCKSIIEEKMRELELQHDVEEAHDIELSTQNMSSTEFLTDGSDKNLTKILNQQANLKRIIDQDNTLQLLKSSLTKIALEIEGLRSACIKLNEEALQSRQELMQAQVKELERYQMNQVRSIAEDYNRHQEILEQRRREILALKREIEREDKDREAYLADVEKKLEKQFKDRQRAISGGSLPFSSIVGQSSGVQVDNSQQMLELTSVDEYAPYGTAPHSRINDSASKSTGRGRGRGRRGRRV